jgi:hypothetical protein
MYYHTKLQDPALSGASIAITSQLLMAAMLVLLMMED